MIFFWSKLSTTFAFFCWLVNDTCLIATQKRNELPSSSGHSLVLWHFKRPSKEQWVSPLQGFPVLCVLQCNLCAKTPDSKGCTHDPARSKAPIQEGTFDLSVVKMTVPTICDITQGAFTHSLSVRALSHNSRMSVGSNLIHGLTTG